MFLIMHDEQEQPSTSMNPGTQAGNEENSTSYEPQGGDYNPINQDSLGGTGPPGGGADDHHSHSSPSHQKYGQINSNSVDHPETKFQLSSQHSGGSGGGSSSGNNNNVVGGTAGSTGGSGLVINEIPPDTKYGFEELCPVCGDKVSGYHYGLLTCESCKGFFKRTVQNKKVYTCVAERSCHIDKTQRKRCPFCRFQKCLNVGMKLEAVRADRMRGGRNKFGPMYKRDRARKLQIMRQRQLAIQTLRGSLGEGGLPISYNSPLPPTSSTTSQQILSSAGLPTNNNTFTNLHIKQEIQIPQVSSLTSSPDSSTSPIAQALGQALGAGGHHHHNTSNLTQTNESGKWSGGGGSGTTGVTSDKYGFDNSNSGLIGNETVGGLLGGPEGGVLTTTIGCSSSNSNSASVGGNNNNSNSSTGGVTNVGGGTTTTGTGSTATTTTTTSSSSSTSYKISPLIREFVNAVDDREWQNSLYNLLQNQTYNQCEVDLFELMCKVLDQNLFSQVDWARNSVFFKDLKVDDQMKLLQHSWSDMLVWDHMHHRMHNNLPDEMTLPNGQKFDLLCLGLLGVPSLADMFIDLTTKLQELKFDVADYISVKFLLLLNPGLSDVRGISNRKCVQEGYDQIQMALHEYTITCYPQIQDKFMKLLMILPDIHAMASRGEDHLYLKHCNGSAPTQTLLMEMLHAKRK